MSVILCRFALRWLGIAMLLTAFYLFILSGIVVDIPGPVETAKSNFIVTFTSGSILRSFILTLAGGALLVKNFKQR